MDETTKKGDRMTPARWARELGPKHAAALKLLTGAEVNAVKKALAAQRKIAELEPVAAELERIGAKLSSLVERGGLVG